MVTPNMNVPPEMVAEYELLYAALESNSDTLTEVKPRQVGLRDPDYVYGRRLGELLQNNTHISRLVLPVTMGSIAPRGVTPRPEHIAMLCHLFETANRCSTCT
jgi:hypothetical protein